MCTDKVFCKCLREKSRKKRQELWREYCLGSYTKTILPQIQLCQFVNCVSKIWWRLLAAFLLFAYSSLCGKRISDRRNKRREFRMCPYRPILEDSWLILERWRSPNLRNVWHSVNGVTFFWNTSNSNTPESDQVYCGSCLSRLQITEYSAIDW